VQGQGIDFHQQYVVTAMDNVASLDDRCLVQFGDISKEITVDVVASFGASFLTCVNTNFAVCIQYALINMLNKCDHALVVFLEFDIAHLIKLDTAPYATAWRARFFF